MADKRVVWPSINDYVRGEDRTGFHFVSIGEGRVRIVASGGNYAEMNAEQLAQLSAAALQAANTLDSAKRIGGEGA